MQKKTITKSVTKRGIASELRAVADIVQYPGNQNTLAVRSFLRTAARNLEHGWSVEQMVGGKLTVGDLFQ